MISVQVRATDPLSAAGLAGIIDSCPELRLSSGHPAVLVYAAERLDSRVVPHLRRTPEHDATPVVLIADEFDGRDLPLAVECRVMGVLPRPAVTGERLVHSIKAAAGGAAVLPARLVGDLLGYLRGLQGGVLQDAGLSASGLTRREISVIRMMAEGLETLEMGARLGCSERTVKTVIHGIIRRLGLRNRSHIVAYAMRYGVI